MAFTPIPAALQAFFHGLPKVELHCHLLGTVRRQTFIELAQRAQAPLSNAEIEAFYTRGDKPVGVLRVLRALDAWLLRSPDDLQRITREYLADAAAHQVHYAEVFWNPTGTLRESAMSYATAQDGILRGMADAQAQCGIVARLVPAIDREASADEATQLVRWMIEHRRDEVLGLGIDYREVDRPPELFVQAYALARQAGFKTTAHAGDFGMPWTNVRSAVELLKVDRIDHGYTVVDAPADFIGRCVDAGIVYTVVPSNSYYLRTLTPERWALDHPIRRMPGLGLKIHPNTDDPALHHISPTQAWAAMHLDFGFSIADVRSFMLNGLDAAWIDASTRRDWRASFSAAFDRLLGAAAGS